MGHHLELQADELKASLAETESKNELLKSDLKDANENLEKERHISLQLAQEVDRLEVEKNYL